MWVDTQKIEGGEHRIWKTNNDKTNLKIFEEIKPKSNLLIAALQNNDAYHDVNPITLINGTRNAFIWPYLVMFQYGKS